MQDVQELQELRQQVVRVVGERREPIVNDAVAVFPFAASQPLETAESTRLCNLVIDLLLAAIRDVDLDGRNPIVADLRSLTQDHGVSVAQLFGLMYLLERTALDELALDETLGATSEQWPAIAQLVRRGSFECLAAFADKLVRESGDSTIDPLTTTHTRLVLDAVLDKEIHRAGRFGHPFALILLDVDRLSEINAGHGYGFGDRVLERIGIAMRSFFREQDWVARHGEDSFAVVLPETVADNALLLAEQLRVMIEERLALHDYRTEEAVRVTVSVAVLIADAVAADARPQHVLEQAEQALVRVKEAGRNRVERVDISFTPDEQAQVQQARRPSIT